MTVRDVRLARSHSGPRLADGPRVADGPGLADGQSAGAEDRFRVADAVDELCQQMTDLCASAVDSLEIAATLEAEVGLTSKTVRARYGFTDVFSLAEEMHRRTILRPAEPEPGPDPWRASPALHVAHGLLYALPAVSYAAAAPSLAGANVPVVLAAGVLISWALSQGMAYLGYARLSRADPGGAARLLRCALAASVLVLLAGLGATALVSPMAAPVFLVAAAQGVYLLGATVLLVMRARWWLLCALAPGMVLGAAYVLAGAPATLAGLGWLPLAVCALTAGVLAVVRTARAGSSTGPIVAGSELRGALPHALFGLLAASLLVFPVVGGGVGHAPMVPVAALLSLPLSLSMGAAEWCLYWYRRRVHRLLESSDTVERFASRARRALLGAAARYLAGVTLLIAATLPVAAATLISLDDAVLWACASYIALGCALFVALLLQTALTGAFTLMACAAALGVEVVLVLDPPLGWGWGVISAQLLACSVLFIGLLARGQRLLSQVVAHT
ncbi:MAG TPA: hypothetical protein VFO16_16210 [Pseudonocardiaceae bacterium]|nr:hypothetical protein [Pseudonocardiaceae bacterium]